VLQADSILRTQGLRSHAEDSDKLLDQLAASSEETLEALDLGVRTHIMYYKTLSMVRRKFVIRDAHTQQVMDSLRHHPTLALAKESTHFIPRLHYHRAMAFIAQLQGQNEELWQHHRDLFALWQTFPKMQAAHIDIYVTSLANFLTACHTTNRLQEMPEIIQHLQSIEPESPSQGIEITHNTLYYTLLHAMNTGNWEVAAATAKDLEAFLVAHKKAVPKARVIAIHYNVAITYFFLELYKPALHALNAILHDEQSLHREDIQQATRLIQAVVHYQLGNLDLLDYLLRSMRRYLQNRDALHSFEETLIKQLKRLAGSPQEHKDILLTLQTELEALENDPANAQAPGLQEVKRWVIASLKGCRLRDVMEEKLERAEQ
jgi:hypothetical protein